MPHVCGTAGAACLGAARVTHPPTFRTTPAPDLGSGVSVARAKTYHRLTSKEAAEIRIGKWLPRGAPPNAKTSICAEVQAAHVGRGTPQRGGRAPPVVPSQPRPCQIGARSGAPNGARTGAWSGRARAGAAHRAAPGAASAPRQREVLRVRAQFVFPLVGSRSCLLPQAPRDADSDCSEPPCLTGSRPSRSARLLRKHRRWWH